MRARVERLVGRLRAGMPAGAVLAVGLLAGLGTGGASGMTTGVTVPLHPSRLTALGLLGASSAGFAVAQGTGYGIPQATGRLLTGARGGVLSNQNEEVDGTLSGVSGSTAYWAAAATSPAAGWVVHAENLGTGARSSYPSPDQPVGWTPDGWISLGDGVLTRHLAADSSSSVLMSGIASASRENEYQEVTVKADGVGAIVSYPVHEAGEWKQAVGLITFGQAGVERLGAYGSTSAGISYVSGTALAPNTVAWSLSTVTGFSEDTYEYTESVSSRSRAGGPVSTIPSTTKSAAIEDLSVTDDQIAIATGFTTQTSETLTMRVWVSGRAKAAWRHITLPAPAEDPASVLYGGMTSLGSEFFVAVGGDTETAAGIYAIGTTDATRVATVPADNDPVQSVNLSAGRLTFSDLPGSLFAGYDGRVKTWRRTVTGGIGGLSLGAESSEPLSVTRPDFSSGAMSSFSAGRGAGVIYPWADGQGRPGPGTLQLLDRNLITHKIKFSDPPTAPTRSSGPYTLPGNGTVYRADGKPMVSLTQRGMLNADLFGSKVAYSTIKGTVEVLDAGWPQSAKKPVVLARQGVCPARQRCSSEVAIWGPTVAWTRTDGTIAVRAMGSPTVRVVQPQVTGLTAAELPDAVSGLRMSEQVLTWRSTYGDLGTWVLDLGSPTSVPVELDSLSQVSVDDHLDAGLNPLGELVVSILPFGQSRPYPPRLIGILASAGFSPNGDGKADSWAPEIDVTKPVDPVLTITRGSTSVRVLTGTGPDGSIRDLNWDGTDTAGSPVPDGLYTWTLTATALDGEGSLIAADGGTTISGTVAVQR